MTSFNQLTPEQDEALTLLAEECAEVIVCITKIQRHGLESENPFRACDGTNADQLENEVGDMLAALDIVYANVGDFAMANVRQAKKQKLETVAKWLHHAKVPLP